MLVESSRHLADGHRKVERSRAGAEETDGEPRPDCSDDPHHEGMHLSEAVDASSDELRA